MKESYADEYYFILASCWINKTFTTFVDVFFFLLYDYKYIQMLQNRHMTQIFLHFIYPK